jgi:hypothetical protein
MFNKISTALKRRLNPELRIKVQLGYLNENLSRTETGIHQLLNFLEDKFDKEFVAYLKALKADKIAEAKEDGECGK